MVTLPAATPVTIPDEEPIVAVAGIALLHVPPPIDADSVLVPPVHTVVPPDITASGFTVIVFVACDVSPHASVATTV